MLIERKAQAATTPNARPAHCLDCPDCQGLCLEAAALRLIPEVVLHAQPTPREVRA